MPRAGGGRARPRRGGRGACGFRLASRACGARLGLVALALLLLAPAAPAAEEDGSPVLRLETVTYVASEAGRRRMVLDAERARLRPEARVLHLEAVRAHVLSGGSARAEGLELRCDRGRFDLATRDFVAEGNVRGVTGDGRRFRTARLRYDHEARRVTTDAAVVLRDATGTYRGGGFRYDVDEARFRLLGGATVVQEP